MEPIEIVSLLVLSTVGVSGENWTFNMYRVAGLDNFDCNNGEYAFSLITTRSKITCTHQCAVDATCKSMFYVPGTTGGTCNGCTSRYKSTDSSTLSILQGSLYFASTFDFVWGDSGYIFIDTIQDFATGISMCNDLGGYPVAIETEAENDFIVSMLVKLNIGDHTYIGLHQPGGNGTNWIWQGTGQVMTYNGFYPTEPNSATELCVIAHWHTMNEWHDVGCNRDEFVLCELSI